MNRLMGPGLMVHSTMGLSVQKKPPLLAQCSVGLSKIEEGSFRVAPVLPVVIQKQQVVLYLLQQLEQILQEGRALEARDAS